MIKDTSKIRAEHKAIKKLDYSNRSRLQVYIENRLIDYGYGVQMNPSKYTLYNMVRRLVSVRMNIDSRSPLNDDQLDEALSIVDQIIPAMSKEN